jgi:uncharacterized repeat protein (TIGR03803 family)
MQSIQTDLASREGSSRTFLGWQQCCRLRRRLSAWSLAGVILGIFYLSAAGNADAQVTILYSFDSGTPTDGILPNGGLVLAPDGSFYDTTFAQFGNVGDMFPAGTIYRFDPTTSAVTFVESFPNTGAHRSPQSPLLLYNGGLVGVTLATNKKGGIIFYLNPSGTLEVWHAFGNGSSVNGSAPIAPLALGPKGKIIYGVTRFGGRDKRGTVYTFNPKNQEEKVLYTFTNSGPSFPYWLLLGKDGNFYGVANSLHGTKIFKMTPAGVVTVLYTFVDFPQGLTLMQASDGTFYGTTQFSHIANNGTLFKMTGTPPNVTVTILHVFGQGTDGKEPSGPVVVGPNGNLYGETGSGGTGSDLNGDGILYEITPDGSTYTILHNFKDGSIPNDGASPAGGLTLGTDNNLYGATSEGGAYNPGPFGGWGTLFKLSP